MFDRHLKIHVTKYIRATASYVLCAILSSKTAHKTNTRQPLLFDTLGVNCQLQTCWQLLPTVFLLSQLLPFLEFMQPTPEFTQLPLFVLQDPSESFLQLPPFCQSVSVSMAPCDSISESTRIMPSVVDGSERLSMKAFTLAS